MDLVVVRFFDGELHPIEKPQDAYSVKTSCFFKHVFQEEEKRILDLKTQWEEKQVVLTKDDALWVASHLFDFLKTCFHVRVGYQDVKTRIFRQFDQALQDIHAATLTLLQAPQNLKHCPREGGTSHS